MASASAKAAPAFEPIEALLNAFDTSESMNQYLLDAIAPEAWRAEPPQPPAPEGKKAKKQGRTIAAIAAHMHNVRLMWLKVLSKDYDLKLPDKLEPDTATVAQVKKALGESHRALRGILEGSLKSTGKVKNFPPDAVRFFSYLVAHDAHHRGQISMLARFSGHPISQSAMFGLWEWNRKK